MKLPAVKNNSDTSATVCFIGTGSVFSFAALKTLLKNNVTVSRIILSGQAPAKPPASCLPVSNVETLTKQNATVQQLAQQHDIAVTYLSHSHNRQQQWQQFCEDDTKHPRPDFVFVACFPEKLPSILLNWPHQKSINLHPSLLPRYRGPDPVYWQLHNKEKCTGISLHILSDELDAGPIVFQQEINFPVNATRYELDILLAQQGAAAFSQLLSGDNFVATEQDASQASYQPMPRLSPKTGSIKITVN